MAPEKSQKVIS